MISASAMVAAFGHGLRAAILQQLAERTQVSIDGANRPRIVARACCPMSVMIAAYFSSGQVDQVVRITCARSAGGQDHHIETMLAELRGLEYQRYRSCQQLIVQAK